jgi:hypothetical protein
MDRCGRPWRAYEGIPPSRLMMSRRSGVRSTVGLLDPEAAAEGGAAIASANAFKTASAPTLLVLHPGSSAIGSKTGISPSLTARRM